MTRMVRWAPDSREWDAGRIRMAVYKIALLTLLNFALAQVAGPDEMIKGMNFIRFSSQYPYNSVSGESSLIDLKELTRINWVAIVPVWWMSDTGSSDIVFMPDISPSDSEVIRIINLAHSLGLKVFLKPEVRCLSGVGRGYHNPRDTNWFVSYRNFISRYALIARQTGCELFSVGVELDQTTDESWEVMEWRKTIRLVRGILSHSPVACLLTYAADWRIFGAIPFWDSLDYIGINAYFPLRDETEPEPLPLPSVDYLSVWWKTSYLPLIKRLADSLVKPVIFTEVGYRSIRGSTRKPRDETLLGDYDEVEQRNGYIACFHSLLGKPWFAGWFWFNWTTGQPDSGGQRVPVDHSYSPRGKKAQEVLRRFNLSICSHKGFCFPTTYDFTYSWGRTHQALNSLVSHYANWVAINSRWLMKDPGAGYDTIKPIPGESPADTSIKRVIKEARKRGLSVALSCYLACSTRVWCGLHNPGNDTNWFQDESLYLVHCARIAEEESVEMLIIGLEINRTMDSPEEAELWRRMIIPAVREIYSGPLCYGASYSDVHPEFWDGIDFCGIHPYFPLADTKFARLVSQGYPWDTMVNQRPNIQDLVKGNLPPYPGNLLAWERWYIPNIYQHWFLRFEKPILFTEIGYRSLDNSALHPSYDYWYGWHRIPKRNDTVVMVTRRNLNGLCFPVDTLVGYIVGDSGTVLKTVNGGKSFTFCASGTDCNLYAVDFPSRDTGYAVGADGVILKTTDGFDGYITVEWRNTYIDFYSVCFPDSPRTGYVVGDSGVILKTTDGGETWERQFAILPSGETLRVQLRSVYFLPGGVNGYIVGEDGTILKTTSGGVNWYKLTSPVKVKFNDVEFVSPDTGFVVGDSSVLLLTADGGRSWTRQVWWRGNMWNFKAVTVPDYDSARFIIGTRGLILRWGDSWPLDGGIQFSNTKDNLNDVLFHRVMRVGYYDLVGFAVGDSGTVLKAFSGGRMRVDFNEQANCYEAVFQAFWRDSLNPRPLPWFYGFHFWKWVTDYEPMWIEHEVQIDDYTPQGKKAGEVVRRWFRNLRSE